MAGKAPLLLAMVLFIVGAAGLALTSAERAEWGPFEPRGPRPPEQRVVIVDMSRPLMDPPALVALSSNSESIVAAEEAPYPFPSAEDQPTAEPTPTPLPPLRIFGISSDDGGVSAAAQTPAPPPPIRIIGIATDEQAPEATEPAATPAPEAAAD
jgi:hypothetical protein